jgi:hypothetical protein
MHPSPDPSSDDRAGALAELIVRYHDGDLQGADLESLRSALASDPACREMFVSLSLQRCALVRILGRERDRLPSGEWEWPAQLNTAAQDDETSLGITSRLAQAARQSKSARFQPLGKRANGVDIHRSLVRRTLAAAAILAVAAGIIVLVLHQSNPPVATLAAAVESTWGGTSKPVRGEALNAGQSLSLQAGVAQLTFTGGAKVIVEGPAQFTLDSPVAMTLSSGRLAANITGGGFTVHTPTATVNDLGTEFGVATTATGATQVEVFQGRVETRTRSAGADGMKPTILTTGQAATVTPSAVTFDPDGAVPQHFVRSLGAVEAPLDVVDLVAGGDGTTHRRGVGIDPATGHVVLGHPVATFPGNGNYHRVPAIPAVDGCFVPDGTRGPTEVDSAGHRFLFPPTGGDSFNRIWTGGTIPSPGRPIYTTLRRVDYSQPGHGLLFIHSNTGLTLNLVAIRRLHPGMVISSFHCTVGNSYMPLNEPASTRPRSDAFVVIDGQSRFQRRAFSNNDEPFVVDVPLGPEDRFLTLTTTDGGDRAKFDWVLWADPVLESRPTSIH